MHRRSVLLGALLAAGLGADASARPCGRGPVHHRRRRPPRPRSPACSATSCRSSRRRPASRCGWSRSAPARRSRSRENGDADVLFVHAQAVGGEVRRRRLRRRAPRRDVQRLRDRRARRPIRPASRAARTPPRRWRRSPRPRRRSPRAATTAAPTRPSSRSGRRPASTSPAASGTWYRETGSGMGPTLNTAAGMDAYALTDRGTWRQLREPGEPRDRWSRATARCSISTASSWSTRRSTRTSRRSSARQFVDWVLSDGGPEGDRRVQDRRPAGVLPERQARLELRARGADHSGQEQCAPPGRLAFLLAPRARRRAPSASVTDSAGRAGRGARPDRARVRGRAARVGAGLRAGAGRLAGWPRAPHPGGARLHRARIPRPAGARPADRARRHRQSRGRAAGQARPDRRLRLGRATPTSRWPTGCRRRPAFPIC